MPLGEGAGRVRIRIDKDVQVVERCQQPGLFRAEHAVTKDIAAHIADADDCERFCLRVEAEGSQVPLHRDPGALRSDAHLFVVIADGAARRESVAKPEAVLLGDVVGGVGEGRGAFVGGHHKVGVIVIAAVHALGRNDLSVLQVVGNGQRGGNEPAVGVDAGIRVGAAFGHKAAFRTVRHDHGVLDNLCLNQPKHLGPVVLLPIGPANAAPGHLAGAQVHPLEVRAVGIDLEQRSRLWQLRQLSGREFVHDQPGVMAIGEVVGANRGLHELIEPAQHLVFVEQLDLVQVGAERVILGGQLLSWIEPVLEVRHQQLRGRAVLEHRLLDKGLFEAVGRLFHVSGVGTQQRDLLPVQVFADHQ